MQRRRREALERLKDQRLGLRAAHRLTRPFSLLLEFSEVPQERGLGSNRDVVFHLTPRSRALFCRGVAEYAMVACAVHHSEYVRKQIQVARAEHFEEPAYLR